MRSQTTPADISTEIGYETKDVDIQKTITAILALVGFFVAAMIGIFFFYLVFIPGYAKVGRQEPFPENRRVPPYPQLQIEPKQDFERYRQAEDKELAGKDAAMPLDQAINVLATQKGIAGIRGDAVRERSTGYPGQTTGEMAPAGSEKTEARPAESTESHKEIGTSPQAKEAGQGAH